MFDQWCLTSPVTKEISPETWSLSFENIKVIRSEGQQRNEDLRFEILEIPNLSMRSEPFYDACCMLRKIYLDCSVFSTTNQKLANKVDIAVRIYITSVTEDTYRWYSRTGSSHRLRVAELHETQSFKKWFHLHALLLSLRHNERNPIWVAWMTRRWHRSKALRNIPELDRSIRRTGGKYRSLGRGPAYALDTRWMTAKSETVREWMQSKYIYPSTAIERLSFTCV